MNKLIAVSLAALMTTSATAALAMDNDTDLKMGTMMDTNKDGMITKKEFMDHLELVVWKNMPKNKDGMVMMKDMHMMKDGTLMKDGVTMNENMKK